MITHPIQTNILKRLVSSKTSLRYRDMKPAEIDNDLYNYHLQYLVKQHLLVKDLGTYGLSDEGKKYILETQPVDILNETVDKFKLAALCLLVVDNNILYQTRSLQPFTGNKELIGGSIKKGEPVTIAAKRRLYEEAGIHAEFQLFGIIRKIRVDNEQNVYSDIIYHICIATDFTGQLIEENSFGNKHWLALDQAIHHENTASYGNKQFANVLQQLKATKQDNIPLFYFEDRSHQDIY